MKKLSPTVRHYLINLGESADLTLLARKRFEEAHGGTPG